MRTKNLLLFILFIFMVLPGMALAEEHNFPAGSLIVPMDSFYQPEAGGGILEAYGLIYRLLSHQDQQCLTVCGDNQICRDKCEHDISVYWVINDQKMDIDGIDLTIEVSEENLAEEGVEAVVRHFKNAGDDPATFVFNSDNGDDHKKISYSGSVFILDVYEQTDEVVTYAKELIDSSEWSAVRVHEALVPFAAPIHRKMRGTPPKIALMNNTEDKTKGNAAILESYLRLAGVCTDVYEVVTPNEIAGIAPDGSSVSSKLRTGGFDFLWAPHWEGMDKYSGDLNSNGSPDVDDIVKEIKLFLESGRALLAECASIETFEHNIHGHFLTDKGFGHNGGTNDEDTIIYNWVTTANSQIADFKYVPEGGHLHNWRPFHAGDPYNFDDLPVLGGVDSVYNSTVKRFTIDNEGWDYYVGGHAFGNTDFGYVVYLGGHKYAACDKSSATQPEPNNHLINLEFDKSISAESFTLTIAYTIGGTTQTPLTVDFTATNMGQKAVGDRLQIDLTEATLENKNIEGIAFRNLAAGDIAISHIQLSWTGSNSSQKLKKLIDNYTDIKHFDGKVSSAVEIPISQQFIIETSAGISGVSCTENNDCSWKNIAGVRYILNTLFNIKYQIINDEYVLSAPVVAHPWLYQGSFEYPSYFGHFRRYDVTLADPIAAWDTADGGIPNAGAGNSDGRRVYTAHYNAVDAIWTKIDFDAAHLDSFKESLIITPGEEEKVINRLRGKDWDYLKNDWVERNDPTSDAFRGNFGGIKHSAPAIVSSNHDRRFTRSREIAYVGDLYGMLHAIDTANGEEQWAYIPSNLLSKLKNDRTDPNAVNDFAAVDASPTVRDIYFDPDNELDINPSWHTILVCPQGFGGKSVFALDVTNPAPDGWKVLWEATDILGPGGGMGHAFRASLDKVLVSETNPQTGERTYRIEWVVYVATSYADIAEDNGGIHIYAFDLKTGQKKWTAFSSEYTDSVNDIPGALTTYDIDGDSFADRVYVGDMNGRMWELNAVGLTNPHGTSDGHQIPLFNAGVGNPISVSPAITRRNGQVILVFGTGGTHWATVADDKRYYVYAVSATTADNLSQAQKNGNFESLGGAIGAMWSLPLEPGEKVWSSPTIAAGTVFIGTAGGSLESGNPRSDVSGGGRLIGLDLDKKAIWDAPIAIGKVRGSLFVSRKHIYLTTIDNTIIQVGGDNWAAGFGDRVVLKAWRQF